MVIRAAAGAGGSACWARMTPTQAEGLGPGELRVLRYLPTNLSTPEIASELSVSVSTVNTHIRKVGANLGAEDRSWAVQRARELRLLSAAFRADRKVTWSR